MECQVENGSDSPRWGRFSSTRIVMNKCCKWKCFFTPLPLNNWQWNLQECYDFVLSSFRPPVILVLKIRDPQISQNSFPIKRRFHDKRKADVKPPPRRSPQPLGWLGQASASPPSCYCCWGSQGNMATEDALSSEIVGRSPGRNSSFGNSKGKPHAKKKDPIQTHANWFPKKRERVLEVALMCKKAFCRSFSASSSPARGRNICCYAPDMASSQAGAKGWLRCWTKTPVEKQLRIVFLWAMEATAGIFSNWREAPFSILSCSTEAMETQFFLCYHSNLSPWSLRKTILPYWLHSDLPTACEACILGGSWRKVEIQNKSGQHNPEHHSFKPLFFLRLLIQVNLPHAKSIWKRTSSHK